MESSTQPVKEDESAEAERGAGGGPAPSTSTTPRSSSTASSRGWTSTTGSCSSPRTESLPLLERVKFCAIYEDNLDEFYMVRVAGLHDQVEASLPAGGADGMTPRDQVAADPRARDRAARAPRGAASRASCCPRSASTGSGSSPTPTPPRSERAELDELFQSQVFPALTPLVFGVGRPFPYISNLSLSLIVVLRDPEQDTEVMARVKVPKELLRRFLPIGDGNDLRRRSRTSSPTTSRRSSRAWRSSTTRSSGSPATPTTTSPTRPTTSARRSRTRSAAAASARSSGSSSAGRLEERLRERLVTLLGIEEDQVYEIEGLIGMDDLFDIAGVSGHAELRYPPFSSSTQAALQGSDGVQADVMAAMREGDILVHHPYDSFTTSVVAFVKQAVNDPDVLAIKQTVYRTSADSPLVPALIEASEKGKQAVCMVELKARFDEQANISWAKKLEQAGVHVVYGIPAMKTHAKCILVARREGDGVRHYAHVGTGNYNPKTARLYTDLGLFTTDPEICSDIAEMFNYLTGYARPQNYRKALIAPFNLYDGLLDEIEATVEAHSAEQPERGSG